MNALALGVTGGIACGKSTVGEILQELNVSVLDADIAAHDLMRPGCEVHKRIVQAFGDNILNCVGEIDRKKLGAVVFADPAKRERLNSLVHPAVQQVRKNWLKKQQHLNQDAAVLIPLLHEVGDIDGWSAVLCVSASDPVVLQRLRARGLNEDEAWCRIHAQMPLEEKEVRSDYVIENNGTMNELKDRIVHILESIREKERKHHG